MKRVSTWYMPMQASTQQRGQRPHRAGDAAVDGEDQAGEGRHEGNGRWAGQGAKIAGFAQAAADRRTHRGVNAIAGPAIATVADAQKNMGEPSARPC
jgi:hypothetical protein